MKMKLKTAVIAAAIALSPMAAQAHPWVMFNGADDKCESAATVGAGSSPEALQEAMRHDGIIPDIQVTNSPDNTKIWEVDVSGVINGSKLTIMYFPDYGNGTGMLLCHSATDGMLPNGDDLK